MDRPELTKENAIRVAREHWGKAERNRVHVSTPDVDLGIGAVGQAWYEAGGSFGHPLPEGSQSFVEFLNELNEAAPEMRLMQPASKQAPKLPKPWVDPVTGQLLPPPTDLKGKTLLRKHDPELADHYEKMAADPYGHVQRLREQEAAALRSKAIKYGAVEHKANPFVFTNAATETEKAKFVQNTPADIVEFYRNETLPIQLPASNLTVRSKLALNPRLDAIVTRASEIMRVWQQQERERLQAEKAAAEKRLKQLEAA